MSAPFVILRRRGGTGVGMSPELVALQGMRAKSKAQGSQLPAELFLPTRDDWGAQDALNGLDWSAVGAPSPSSPEPLAVTRAS